MCLASSTEDLVELVVDMLDIELLGLLLLAFGSVPVGGVITIDIAESERGRLSSLSLVLLL